jgi:hypothetical protein
MAGKKCFTALNRLLGGSRVKLDCNMASRATLCNKLNVLKPVSTTKVIVVLFREGNLVKNCSCT